VSDFFNFIFLTLGDKNMKNTQDKDKNQSRSNQQNDKAGIDKNRDSNLRQDQKQQGQNKFNSGKTQSDSDKSGKK